MESINEKLVRVRTPFFPNELHFRFHSENDGLYARYGEAPLGISEFITPFRSRLADLDAALERIRKSADTDRIATADDDFDRSFSGMHEYTRSCRNHFDPAVRRAAENLAVVFDHYGNIGKEAYRQELASSYNLMQELRARLTDVQALNLDPWMTAHEQAAAALAALLDSRTGETAQQTDLRVREVRREVDALYQQITDRIDAMINLHGKEFVPGFVAEYNAHATGTKTNSRSTSDAYGQ
jgi:AcrR family transcriptional regulator